MKKDLATQKVPAHVAFVLTNGVKIQSLTELLSEIQSMTTEEFGHFVHSSHNHFANWVEDIFELEDLPNALRSVHTKKDTVAVLKEALSYQEVPTTSSKSPNKSRTPVPQPTVIDDAHKNPLAQKVGHITDHIDKMHTHLAHMTKYDTHTPAHTAKSYEPITEEIKDKLIDFGFGLAIGLIVGILIAKGLGAF